MRKTPQGKLLILGLWATSMLSVLIMLGCWPFFDLMLRYMGDQAFSIRMNLFHGREWLFLVDLVLLTGIGWLLYSSNLSTGKNIRLLFWSEVFILFLGFFFSDLLLPLLRLLGG